MSLARPLAGLVGARVRVGSVVVGEVGGVILDETEARVLGLEVLCADRARRFLPWVAAEPDGGGVRARSALFLLDEVSSYARRGAVVVQAVPPDDPREIAADGAVTFRRTATRV